MPESGLVVGGHGERQNKMLNKIIYAYIFLTFAAFFVANAHGQEILLTWEHPTEREDGTALGLGEIDGYRLYHDLSGVKNGVIEISPGTSFTFPVEGVGVYTFQISTVSFEQEGRKSDPVSVQVNEHYSEPVAPVINSATFSCDGCGLQVVQ